MDLKAQRAAALKAAQDIVGDGKTALTDEQHTQVKAHLDEVDAIDAKLAAVKESNALVARLTGYGAGDSDEAEFSPEGKSTERDENGRRKGLVPFDRPVSKRFTDSDAYKAFKSSNPNGPSEGAPIRVEAKGMGSVVELGIGKKELTTITHGEWVSEERQAGYRNYLAADQPFTFLNLVTVGTTDVAYSEYAQIVSETDMAAVVAEGGLKPLSDIATDTQSSKAYTYADGFDVTNQMLADDGALVAFMESRIRQHVRGVIERKLFNGTGAGTEPLGILNTSGTLSRAFDTDVMTTLARSLELFSTTNPDLDPQAIVMHPSAIWNLRLLKDGNGNYQLGNPLQQGPIPTPWGVPIIPSAKLAVGTALVGRFDSVQYLEMEPLTVLAFNQHKDYAQRNKVYVRAESRGRQVFYAPRELVVASITGA